ncbi:hypothetical protein PIB30_016220 [Stylosanthes scabra]|uniref:Uncharacterized protein n=1 Tax=Stylosanthes scabra TaxID=79078 RepID=A0ABU6W7A0_9FABA|nr:hypothetical protein [Stylosanthes scabra]
MSLVQSKPELFTIGEVQNLLFNHEINIEKFKQLSLITAQANLVHNSSSSSNFQNRNYGASDYTGPDQLYVANGTGISIAKQGDTRSSS